MIFIHHFEQVKEIGGKVITSSPLWPAGQLLMDRLPETRLIFRYI